MYKYCKSEQSSERQKRMSGCLLELMQTIPYNDISITMLCEYAGIPRCAFYRYFTNKDAVLTYLLDQKLAEFLERILLIYQASPRQEVSSYIAVWLQEYRRSDALWDIFSTNEKYGILLKKMVEFCIRLGSAESDVACRNLTTKKLIFYAYGFQGILDIWKHMGYRQNEEELADQICSILYAPLIELTPSNQQASKVLSELKNIREYVE